MADGVAVTPGTGVTMLTDDTGGTGHAQVVKLAISTDGSPTLIPAEATYGLDVDVTRSALPSGASTSANQTTLIGHVDGIEALLTTIDADTSALFATVAGSELQVDIVSSALPSGAATLAEQQTQSTALSAIVTDAAAIEVLLGTIDADTSALFGTVAGSELQVDIVSSALPSGASTLAEQQTQTASLSVLDDWDESDRAKVNPIVGQAGIAAGTGVDGATVPRVTLATNVPLPAGTNGIGKLTANSGVTIGAVEIAAAQTLATVTTVGAVTAISNALPAGTNAIGKLAANSGVDIGDVDVTSTVLPVVASTGTVTSVADTASSTTLLSSSAARKGFRIFNDSTVTCYVKYGATATTTDFTVAIPAGGYLEENHYYGIVDAIWASNASGSARITSLA